MNKELSRKLNTIAQAIYDKKGFNILVLDVRGVSSLTDFVVLAEGKIDRHVKALSTSVKNALGDLGIRPLYVEGERSGDWVVVDCGEVVVHLLLPDFRERYALEQLWRPAKIVDVQIDTSHKITKNQESYG